MDQQTEKALEGESMTATTIAAILRARVRETDSRSSQGACIDAVAGRGPRAVVRGQR
jgi:hypothetical protein